MEKSATLLRNQLSIYFDQYANDIIQNNCQKNWHGLNMLMDMYRRGVVHLQVDTQF